MAIADGLLADIPLFASLSARQRRSLARSMHERTFPAGTEVSQEGEEGAAFFVILSGTAVVSVRGIARPTLRPGDHFGEMALVDGQPRSAHIVAMEELRCLGMSEPDFRPWLMAHPEVMWALLASLVSRLRVAEAAAS